MAKGLQALAAISSVEASPLNLTYIHQLKRRTRLGSRMIDHCLGGF